MVKILKLICVITCDIALRSYFFGKQNPTLWTVVPLTMFLKRIRTQKYKRREPEMFQKLTKYTQEMGPKFD